MKNKFNEKIVIFIMRGAAGHGYDGAICIKSSTLYTCTMHKKILDIYIISCGKLELASFTLLLVTE